MKSIALFLFVVAGHVCLATDLNISRPLLYLEDDSAYAVFNLSWENAFDNERNNDAVWLFCKSKGQNGDSKHISVLSTGHQVVNVFSEDPRLEFQVSEDRVGLFIFPIENYQGNVHVTVKLKLNKTSFEGINTRNSSFKVFGIEMVMIPEGGFFAGSTENRAIERGSIYAPKGDAKSLVKIKSEDQDLLVSEDGDLYYQQNEGYEGDQQGTIPSTYPKGVNPYSIMKYELTEGQYVDFLNNISPNQSQQRSPHQEDGYAGTIANTNGSFISDFPKRPASFIGWDDAMAYADWAGLRPMTEFEFTKASRGPNKPEGIGFPWGSASKERIQRLPDPNGNLVMLNGWDESQLTDENRAYFGASYYWVMDLAGSLWERMVTIGHPRGRAFQGSHGDGILSEDGNANDDNWPVGEEGTGGIGFRGGGFYGYDREYHDFNPFSPVSFRPYGGWHGGMRSLSYGTRFVRTIKPNE